MTARVTAIIPTYRRPTSLGRAIESVLAQTLTDLELHVYDNASSDETAAVVARYRARDPRVHYHCHPRNIGGVENLRYAMQRVESAFFSCINDDDLLLPGFYEAGISALRTNPGALFAAFPVLEVDEAGRVMGYDRLLPGLYSPPEGFLAIATRDIPIWTGILWNSDVLACAGNLSTNSAVMVDLDYLLRVAARGSFVVPSVPGAVFLHHEGGASAGASVDSTYKGGSAVVATVRSMDFLPPTVRLAAIHSLEQRLADLVFVLGIGASRRGRFVEARQASALLQSAFHRTWKALGIYFLAALCKWIPTARSALNWLVMVHRPYRRHEWIGRRYSVLEELDRLGLRVPPPLKDQLRDVAVPLDATRAKGFDSPC
jgi:glycosyltransferase involved in cell wall biosynthesis